jgi:hypothetical protein
METMLVRNRNLARYPHRFSFRAPKHLDYPYALRCVSQRRGRSGRATRDEAMMQSARDFSRPNASRGS